VIKMRVVAAGVPGVGKTTILEEVSKKANYPIVNYGTLMFEMAQKEGLVDNRDEMRKLPVSIQKDLQKRAAEKIAKMDNVIVDTHLTIKTPSGYLPGLPKWVLDAMKPEMIVVIEATPQEIFDRRKKDTTRKRDFEGVEDIEEHLRINRYTAFACSIYTGATVLILKNSEGKLDDAVNRFMEALR
jgi:adenylate kinase